MATELKFETVDIPANAYKRQAAPNPFDGVFPADDKALAQVFPYDSDEHRKAVEALKRQARAAAKAVDRTARIVDEVFKEKDSKNVNHTYVKLTVWTVKRIVRKGKDNAAPADAPAAK